MEKSQAKYIKCYACTTFNSILLISCNSPNDALLTLAFKHATLKVALR